MFYLASSLGKPLLGEAVVRQRTVSAEEPEAARGGGEGTTGRGWEKSTRSLGVQYVSITMTPNDLLAELRTAIEAQNFPEIMTTAQAAKFLGVSEDYLRDHRRSKSGPPYSQPALKIVRYMRSDLIAWLNRSRVAA